MNLRDYTLQELVRLRRETNDAALRHQLDDELRTRYAHDPEGAEYRLRDLAHEWGMAIADLMSGFAPENRAAAEPAQRRYQHPFDPRLTWSGTGAKPGWVREWEARGRSLSELEVRGPH